MREQPVIKTFIQDGNYYMYSPYTNHVIRLTKKQYEETKKLERLGFKEYIRKNEGTEIYNDLEILMQNGFLSSAFVKTIKHPASDEYIAISNRYISRIILQVTQRCNFSCRYCHDAQPGSASTIDGMSDMSWTVAKKSIDFLVEHSQDSESITIYFYGGEPLLNFDIIQRVVKYAEERINSKHITYRLTTNGSLLNKCIAEFLHEYRFKIAISLDGGKEIQNRHRKYRNGDATFEDVWENVELIRSAWGMHFIDDIMFLPVIFADENKQIVLDFFASHGIYQNQISFLDANTSGIDYSDGSLHLKLINENVNYLNEDDDNESYEWMMKEYQNKHSIGEIWHHLGPCVPGTHKLFVNTNGEFYPCEKVLNYPDLCIGNIYSGIDAACATRLTNIGLLTEDECKTCWAMRFCKLCLVHCIDEEKCCISKEIKLLHCESTRKKALKFLNKYIHKTSIVSQYLED